MRIANLLKLFSPFCLLLCLLFSYSALETEASDDDSYTTKVEAWRKKREEGLKKPYGWLSAAGLDLIEQGSNPVGSAKDTVVKLPADLPERAGSFVVEKNQVYFVPQPGVPAFLNDEPLTDKTLLSWQQRPTSEIQIDRVKLKVLRRPLRDGARVRVRDPQSATRTKFKGLTWYPVKQDYRVLATFKPDKKQQTMRVTNSQGGENIIKRVGTLSFTVNQTPTTMIAFDGGESAFFLIFRDQTSGKTTYGSGRFLRAEKPDNQGRVWLDFNKAYTPPCAFTKFATCPLPPMENFFAVAVEAGEKA